MRCSGSRRTTTSSSTASSSSTCRWAVAIRACRRGPGVSTSIRGRSAVPYYICPNCKDRSIDIDGKEGLSDDAVACRRCGFGFLFELMDDYYPAPSAGLVVADQQGRILAIGRGVYELTGWGE